jgi:hypothetical protein
MGSGAGSAPNLGPPTRLRPSGSPVDRLRASLPATIRLQQHAIEAPPRVVLAKRDYVLFARSLRGWLRLTIEGIARIQSETFSMTDVMRACAPLAAEEFPDNRHVREKLRQQMQRLRDLGLVRFLGNGRYELLARPK